jgi:hypothetical protein
MLTLSPAAWQGGNRLNHGIICRRAGRTSVTPAGAAGQPK